MLIRKGLEELGIEVIDKIEDKNIIELANQISNKLINRFSNIDLSYIDIYKKLLDTEMYYAKIPKELSSANYDYKTSSIFFSEDTNFYDINEYTFHECIHKLQETRDKKGNIIGFGLCEVNELSVKGAALNEGAIQFVATKALDLQEKIVTVYDIRMSSKTEYYPMLTNLISQISYLLDEDILIDSVINSNEKFKIEIIDNLGESQYNQIEKNCNELLKIKDNISNIQKSAWDIEDSDEKIEHNIEMIRDLYFQTQNIIYTSFFEGFLKRAENELEISFLKEKLNSYRNIIGKNENYYDFDKYYIDFNKRADKKIEEFKNKKALMVISDNIFFKIFKKIKSLFTTPRKEYYK